MKEVYLSDVCEIQYGYPFDSSQFSASDGMPLVRIRDVVRGYSETYTNEPCGDEYIVNDGDLLVGMDGEFNIARWKGGKALLNQRVCRLTAKTGMDETYLFYFMQKELKKIEDKTPFATVKHLSAKQLNAIMVPMRPMEEQKKIAAVLDEVDEQRTSRQRQIDTLEKLVQSRFYEIFGELSDTSYSVKELGDLCEFIKDGTHNTPVYVDETKGYKFLSSKDVTSGQIDWTNTKFIPEELHDELQKRVAPRRGDILLAKNGTIGIPAIVETDEVFDIYVSLALLRFYPGYNVKYLWAAMRTDETKKQFNERIKGIGVPNLHLGEIKKTKIIVPPIDLQNEFGNFVDKTNKLKFAIQQSLEKQETLKKSLMQQYFR